MVTISSDDMTGRQWSVFLVELNLMKQHWARFATVKIDTPGYLIKSFDGASESIMKKKKNEMGYYSFTQHDRSRGNKNKNKWT